jgi:hypothetical protein
METIGYIEKFYIYKVASLPLEVTLRHCINQYYTEIKIEVKPRVTPHPAFQTFLL